MANISNTGSRNTFLDGYGILMSSETTPSQTVLSVDTTNNKIGINKLTPTVELDITGSVAMSSTLAVQTNKLVVDGYGHVGINSAPSASYKLQVVGDVSITGTTTISGTLIQFNATALEVVDPIATFNNGGTDATASGGGLVIQRNPSTNATLSWNNTKNNFEAGVVGNVSSIIRADGNSDGAPITIGTTDAFDLIIQSAGVNRMQISHTTGNITVAANQSISISGTLTNAGISSIQDTLSPPGTVVAFFPGYFTSNANAGFTATLGGNSASSVNTWLATNGYSQWAVCDGTGYNIAGSPIFNGSGRFIPNLTDERFLHGDNTVGPTGGTNSGSHVHPISTSLSGVNIAHSHSTTAAGNLVPGNGASGVTTVASTNPASSSTGSALNPGGTPYASPSLLVNLDHSHGGSLSHYHESGPVPSAAPNGYYYMMVGLASNGPAQTAAFFEIYDTSAFPGFWTSSNAVTYSPVNNQTNIGGTACNVFGQTTTTSMPLSGTTPSLSSVSLDHSHSIPTHSHPLQGHSHSVNPHNHSAGSHSHAATPVTTWDLPATFNSQFTHNHNITAQVGPGAEFQGTENRPQYLSCFYIMRVK